jgi:hypothetical protein
MLLLLFFAVGTYCWLVSKRALMGGGGNRVKTGNESVYRHVDADDISKAYGLGGVMAPVSVYSDVVSSVSA